ncbi:MAG: sulfatase-like hydrolase/transferase [Pseudomonadota bacterium]
MNGAAAAKDLNLLLITADQLRADVVFGRLGEAVELPNLARLKARGVSFENHVTVTAPCGPARASLLTGLYASNHGSVRNGTPLRRGTDNLALQLRRAGREPLLFGYTDATPDPEGLDPADPDLTSYEQVLPGFREIVEMRFEAPMTWLAALGRRGYALPRPLPERAFELMMPAAEAGRAPRIDDPAMYRAEDSDTAFLTDAFLAHMDVRRDHPWTAHLTWIRPHPPLVAPAPYNRLVAPGDVPARAGALADHAFTRAWFSERASFGLWMGFDGDCEGLPEADIAALRAVYLGLVAEVDAHLGRILDWLEETGQAERTVIVFTSDHGEMLGDGRMWGKHSVFDPAFRIPLIVVDPRREGSAGRRVTAPTESVDVAPTLLALAGRAAPAPWDGAALTPWLDGETPQGWRDAQLMQIDFAEPHAPTRFQRAWGEDACGCAAAILREGRWKLVVFSGGPPPMLFDLEADPGETRDRAGDPAAAAELARMAAKLAARQARQGGRGTAHLAIGV